jgi:hypothetical protein
MIPMSSMETGASRGRKLRAAISAIVIVAGCSGPTERVTTPEPEAGRDARDQRWVVDSFSDMDPVRALVTTPEHLWIATPGGLLRYALGGGDPLRLTGNAGPGGQRMVAVVAGPRGLLWALSEGGVAFFEEGAWSRPSAGPLPEVGDLSAMTVGADGSVWVGGSRGLVSTDGRSWARWTAEAEVTCLSASPDADGGLWVGTNAQGIWHVASDGMVSQHVADRGMPCGTVRAIEAVAGGQVWAICQRGEGSVLAHHDGTRWTALTAPLPERPEDLARSRDRILVLTSSHLWRIADRAPEQPLSTGDVALSEVFHGDPARPRRQLVRPGPASDAPESRSTAEPPASTAFVHPFELARPDGETPLPPILRPVDVQVRQGARVVECDERGIWIGTNGLGVTRVTGRGEERVYRTLDLLVTERPFTVAADGEGRAWFLTRDLRAGQLSSLGGYFEPVTVERDATAGIQVLSFGSRGTDAYALGRVRGRNTIRIYQFAGQQWTELVTRDLDFGEVAAELSFFEIDPRGKFWIGVLLPRAPGSEPVRRGVIVVDIENEETTFHGQEPRGPGAVQIPDDIAVVDFTASGDAWLGGLNGAVLLRPDGTMRQFSEANGLQGDIVSDLAVDRNDVPWVATPSGVGRYQDGSWRFFLDDWPREMNVGSLAIDSRGQLWTGGTRGAVHYDGMRWETITTREGLVSDRIRSVHVDGRDRVWFVTDAGISLLERP